MIDLTVAQIAEIVGGTLADISPEAAAELHVTGTVEFDSRAVGPGGLFLALPGARSDGHDHAALGGGGRRGRRAGRPAGRGSRHRGCPGAAGRADGGRAGVLEHDADGSGAAVLAALAKLAKAVAAELVAGGLTIIGITGSSGKTSTKDLVAAVLEPLGEVVAPPGSFNNELGHPWTVLRATRRTDYLVLEMSARHPGNIAALAADRPAGDRGGPQRRHRPPGRVRLPRSHRAHQIRTAASGSGVGRGHPQRRRPGGGGDGRRHRGAGWSGSAGPANRLRAQRRLGRGVSLDELARPRFTLHAQDARARRLRSAARRLRRPSGHQRAVRRRRRAGMRRQRRAGGGRAGRERGRCRGTGCR